MNPEELKQILAIDQENNTILKRLLRAQLIQGWIRGAYIFIMIAFVYGGYVFLKPMLNNLLGTYQNVFNLSNENTEGLESKANVDIEKINELLKTLK